MERFQRNWLARSIHFPGKNTRRKISIRKQTILKRIFVTTSTCDKQTAESIELCANTFSTTGVLLTLLHVGLQSCWCPLLFMVVLRLRAIVPLKGQYIYSFMHLFWRIACVRELRLETNFCPVVILIALYIISSCVYSTIQIGHFETIDGIISFIGHIPTELCRPFPIIVRYAQLKPISPKYNWINCFLFYSLLLTANSKSELVNNDGKKIYNFI